MHPLILEELNKREDDVLYADISTNEEGLIFWCMQYGKVVELLSPSETREKIKTIVNDMNQKYEK